MNTTTLVARTLFTFDSLQAGSTQTFQIAVQHWTSGTFAAPSYALLTVAKPSGRLLSLSIVGHQGSNTTACNVTLSIDITMKSGDPSALPLDYNTYRGYRI